MTDELRALARHGFGELGGAMGWIGDVHRTIARRAFASAGAGARPAQTVHDTVADRPGRRPAAVRAARRFVTATVTRSPRHPLGRLVGDWLVLQPSGSGRGRTRRIPFRDEHGLHVGGTHHLALLNHPRVPERLAAWLAAEHAHEPLRARR